jgi:hypothetical protein
MNEFYHYACSLFCATLAFADKNRKSKLKRMLLCLMVSTIYLAAVADPERGNLLLAAMPLYKRE